MNSAPFLIAGSPFDVLQNIDGEILGVIILVSSILFFVTLITAIVSFARTHRDVTLARMHKEMVEELLAKGFQPEQISPLLNQDSRWTKMRRAFMKFPFRKFRRRQQRQYASQPVPPVKNRAHAV